MNGLCYQAPPASSSFTLVPCYILVRPNEQGCFQGVKTEVITSYRGDLTSFSGFRAIDELNGLKVRQLVWTTFESDHKYPEVFFDQKDAEGTCKFVNAEVLYQRRLQSSTDEPLAFFVVLSIDIRVPWTGVKIEKWQERQNGRK